MLQVQLQSSDLTWEEPPVVRSQLMLQLGLRVTALDRLSLFFQSAVFTKAQSSSRKGEGVRVAPPPSTKSSVPYPLKAQGRNCVT